VDIHVETTGSGPAVLWIHGYTMDSTVWQPLWQLLPGFRHIGIDLPGHGRSGALSRDDTLPAVTSRIAEIAQAEQARRVVALSFGSCVALQLAAVCPDLVTRLAVGAPTIAGASSAAGAADREMQLALLHRIAGPGPHMTKLWMTSPPDIFLGTEQRPEVREQLRQVIDRHTWAPLASGSMRSLAAHVHTDAALSRIGAATLVLTGDQDMPAFFANASRLAAVLPRCTLLTVPKAGHLCLLERPDVVAGPLLAHLSVG
jgi:pimeloyl-ACP methyl ester carboxylesterase